MQGGGFRVCAGGGGGRVSVELLMALQVMLAGGRGGGPYVQVLAVGCRA